MGRIKKTNRPDGTAIAYTYDGNGNMTILTNPQNTNYTFGYTANSQRKAYTAPISGSYQYTYDKERKLKTAHFLQADLSQTPTQMAC
ncbi:MAG: RHS repeat protein [Nitrospirae bacterium]|nr:RHS repeat protein [Nitrospirota bacterium]